MFTKDLAIFGTCAAAIRNRPDGGHEELILTAFVISLSRLLPRTLLPSHLSFALFLFLSPTLSLICITRTTRLWIRTPTHTRLAVARQKSYISPGHSPERNIETRETDMDCPTYGWQEEGHWRGRRPSVLVSMSSEICNNRTLLRLLICSPKETIENSKKCHLRELSFRHRFNFITKRTVSQITFYTEK